MRIAILAFYGRQKRPVSSNRIYGLLRGLSSLGADVYFLTIPTLLPPEECFDISFCKGIIEFSTIYIPRPIYEVGRGIVSKIIRRNLMMETSRVAPEKERPWFYNFLRNVWRLRYASPIFREDLNVGGQVVLRFPTERRLLRYILENDIQVLITSHEPPMSHELGLYLKKRLGKRLYWIADFRDPMVGGYAFGDYSGFVGYSGKLAKIQRETVTFADMVTMVSHSIIRDTLEFVRRVGLSVDVNKFFCLYNGFLEDFQDLQQLSSLLVGGERKLRISYTGTIYPGKRDLSTLFQALGILSSEEAERVEFVYTGNQGDFVRHMVEKYQLRSVCRVLGSVTKEEALRIQKDSDILLLLKSDSDRGVFTGKYFEYLSSGKPILVVGDRDDEFNDVARRVGRVRIVPNGPGGVYEIVEVLRFLLKDSASWEEKVRAVFGDRRNDEVYRFNWNYLSKCLYERIVQDFEVGGICGGH